MNRLTKSGRIFRFPILIILLVIILLFLSPFLLSWITRTIITIIDRNQVRATWLNSAELLSSMPHLQFYFSKEVDPILVETSFFSEPEAQGLWIWLEEDLAIWQPQKPIQSGQIMRFGFQELEEDTGTNTVRIKSITWQTFVREPEIVFLKGTEDGKELFKLSLSAPEIENQLTKTDGWVYDFTVSPDGERIIFSKMNDQSGMDLWLIGRHGESPNMVLDCGVDRCSSPDWNPIRDQIVYLMEKSITSSLTWDLPVPYRLNLVTGNVSALFKDQNQIGYDPIWSSRGQWISIWQGDRGGTVILQAESQEVGYADPDSEDTGCWSPEERYFYYSNVRQEGLPIVSIIYQVEILSGLRDFYTDGSLLDLGYNYYYPVCHPNGEGLLAVVQVDPKIPQRELWWIQADGSYQKIYTDLSQMVTQFTWNPAGSRVMFLRDTLLGLQDGSKIMIWEKDSGEELSEISDHVFKARWLP